MQHTVVSEHYNYINEVAKIGHFLVWLLPIRLVFLVLLHVLKLVLRDQFALVLVTEAHRGKSEYLG